MLPSKTEMTKFVGEHPIVSILGFLVIGDASFRLLRAFTSPKGASPYSNRYFGNVALGGISADGIGSAPIELGLSTSTTTSTSSSHPPIYMDPVPTLQQDFNIPLKEFGQMRKGQTPPKMRRRLAQGHLRQVKSSFLGKQVINEKDSKQRQSDMAVPAMFGMTDIMPEQAEGWTE